MRLMMLGVNHRTATVALREKLAATERDAAQPMQRIHARFEHCETVLLSTCNRYEWYIARPSHASPTPDELRDAVAELTGMRPDDLLPHTILREQKEAAKHLYRVAGGLDSMVIGESQILGQVKRAYETAIEEQTVGPVLHMLFQGAIATGRKLRRETGIGEGRVSVGSVAVDFARRIFERFDDKTVVCLGAGEMAKTALVHFQSLQPHKLWVCNRSPQRAHDLAEHLKLTMPAGGVRSFDDLDALLAEADVVLTSTGSPQPLITADRFKPILKKRRYRPVFFIDIALPRDVDPAVGSLTNVYRYDLDDLQQAIAAAHEQRSGQVQQCEQHITAAVDACISQIQHRDIGRIIRALRQRLLDISEDEKQRTLRKLAALNDQRAGDIIEEHTHRLINKILHLPLSKLDQKDGNAPLGFYAAALRALFELDDEASEESADATSHQREEPTRAQAMDDEPDSDTSPAAPAPRQAAERGDGY